MSYLNQIQDTAIIPIENLIEIEELEQSCATAKVTLVDPNDTGNNWASSNAASYYSWFENSKTNLEGSLDPQNDIVIYFNLNDTENFLNTNKNCSDFKYAINVIGTYINIAKAKNTNNASSLVIPSEEIVSILHESKDKVGTDDIKQAREFLKRLLIIQESERRSTCLDEIFDYVDDLIIVNKFNIVEFVLNEIDTDLYKVHVLLGFLSITFPHKNKIQTRLAFYERVKASLSKNYSSEEVLDFLSGLI